MIMIQMTHQSGESIYHRVACTKGVKLKTKKILSKYFKRPEGQKKYV